MSDSPSVQTGTYPIADEVMQLARAMVNDMLRDTAGRILTNTAPFTVVYLNSAIRKVQRYFANNGIESFVNDAVILAAIGAAATSDPSVQCYIGPNGYFDGAVINAQPRLPIDLILPLAVWARQSSSVGDFTPVMPMKSDGLMGARPGQGIGVYEWRNDRINFVGANAVMDLRIRYEASIPSVAAGTNLAQTTIPLRDAQEALAAWVVYFYAFARGSAQRTEAKQMAQEEMDEVIQRYVRKDQRIAIRPGGFRDGGNSIDGSLSGSYR
jgi:hypothetical protein